MRFSINFSDFVNLLMGRHTSIVDHDLERQSASSRESNHAKSRAGTDQRGARSPVGGWLFDGYPMDGKQSRWLARALRGCALWQGGKKFERNRQKLDQVKPLPFIDGVPREPVQPPAEDDLLLHRGIDGFQRQERWREQSDKNLHYPIAESFYIWAFRSSGSAHFRHRCACFIRLRR